EAWVAAQDTTGGAGKFLRKYAAFTLLVIDEWLLDKPTESMRTMLLELMERRYGETSTVFCTQYQQKDWHQRLGAGVHADAIDYGSVSGTHQGNLSGTHFGCFGVSGAI
ncbi:hypothetical protein JF66_22815, partial [Cryobacterium sp. MLB-32]|uniref:ATP-binding protein n=1 Tax=Cryobacterium sp. MLB-32 TaxID=1529318 RepID=UPI0004E77CD5